jgi:uncharacterized protein (TIGR03067 family)
LLVLSVFIAKSRNQVDRRFNVVLFKEGALAMPRPALFLCATFCLIPALAYAQKSNPNSSEKDLQGTWQAIDAEGNGEKLDEDKFNELQIVIQSNTFGIKPDGEGRKTTFTVDSSKTPGTINLIPLDGDRKGTIVPGIYSMQNGQLKICLNIWGKDSALRPTEFKTRQGDGCVFVTLKRTTQK